MAQVSYGTITITDTNDVESIIVEYNRNQSTTTPPAQTDSGWSTNRPAWEQGYYIWQRTRTHRSGTQAGDDMLGNAVCITGSAGQNGTSITISSIRYAISTTESQPADSSFTYTSVPTVAEGSWLWTLTTYNNGNKMYTKSKQGTSGTSVTVSSVKYAISEENTIVDEGVYSFRNTGDGKGVGSKEEDVLVGGSLVWNQISDNSRASTTTLGITFTNNGDGSITANGTATDSAVFNSVEHVSAQVGHVYLINGCPNGGGTRSYFIHNPFTTQQKDIGNGAIFKYQEGNSRILTQIYIYMGTTVSNVVFKPQLIDLTTLFGNSTVADYVYSLEQSTAGAGIAWLRKYFPKIFEWHEYDAGTMIHVGGLQSHRMVGFNQWDEEWEVGHYNTSGNKDTISDRIRSTNYIPVFPSTQYYAQSPSSNTFIRICYYDSDKNFINYEDRVTKLFTTPSNACYLRFSLSANYGTTYNHDICINLSNSSKNGTYEPYKSNEYALDPNWVGRGILKLNSNNEPYFDGDLYPSDGKCTDRYGIVDLGSLNYSKDSDTLFYAPVPNALGYYVPNGNTQLCSKYMNAPTASRWTDKTCRFGTVSTNINICDSDFSGKTASEVKALLSGVMLVYELATPTSSQAQPFSSPQTCYPDGTEEYVSTSIISVGHNTTYFLGTTTQPVDSEFTYNNPPDVEDGQWLWVRTIYSDNSKTYLKTRQGFSGESGRSLSDTITEYTTAASSVNITEDNMGNCTWSENVPNYSSSTPTYWVRITNRYSNPVTVEYIIYKDNGITDAMATAVAANSTANQANQTANQANQIANTANTNVTNLQTKLKYYWTNEVAHTNGSGGWTKPNYPAGTYAASGISGTTFDSENSSTYGYNTLYANGIKLRYNAINLGELTGSSLIFYKPSTTTQGAKGMELTSSNLKFYDATGTVAQATFGGTQATISGTINVYDGKIGNNNSNYWYIGNYTDYNQNSSAIIKSIGTASIQLNETNTWRVSTNRIHTAWAPSTGTDAFKLHFPKFNDSSSTSKYWDYGLHLPTSYSDKFLYIRNASGSESLDNLLNDLDDGGYNYWTYKFYIDGEGNLHAGDVYSNGILISGQSAPYLLKSGGTITGNLEINGTLTKGGKTVTYLTSTPTNGQILVADGTSGSIKTSGYTIATSVPSGALFTDKNVQTSQANTTKIYLAGTSTTGTTTGTLSYDSNVYLTTTAGTLHATTFEGNLSGTATKANQDGDGNVIKTTYLKLSGGQITGPVSFGDSVSMDEATIGNLIVNGNASFTNNISANTINEVAVGSSPKFTDTTYTFASGTNNFTVTPSGGTAQTITVTPSITNNVTGSGTNGYLAKFTGANTIGNGPQLGSATTTYLRNDGTWATPPGTYSLPLAANGTRGGVQIGYTQSGKNYPVQLSSEKMYVNVPWTDTTYTVATGDSNGQIKVTPSSGNTYNISVKGLGSAAFVNTSLFPIVSTYTLAAGKAVRIQYPIQVPVLISAQRSNGGGRLILLGGGYGSEGTVRNDFQELVSSNSAYFTWTLPSSSNISHSIEIMNVNTAGTASITVWSSDVATFTEIDALSDTAMNRIIITSANYTDYTVTKTGTGASGTWGINITGNSANITGTVAIDHGGTGKTTANDAINALLSGLPTWSADPTDTTYFIHQDTAGSATYGKVPASTIWNYISGKLPSWSKASSKPSYTYSEIGSAPDAIVDATVNEQGVIVLTKNGGGTIPLSTEIAVVESQGANKLVTAGTTTGINVGSAAEPVYFSAGVPVKGNTIPKLNNATTGGTFYAPTTAGTSGQVLTSSGGAPGWTNQSSLSVGSATKATQDSDGSVINTTYLKLAGGKMTGGLEISGHINCANGSASNLAWTWGGGGYHNAYNNIVLHGDATTGSSGIAFVSDKGSTNINAPSDRGFIQFHAYGITTATAEGTNPTLATSGEANRLVIGVGNDVTDEIWLQTPAVYGLRHQVGATTYTIPSLSATTTTANYPLISTTTAGLYSQNTSITMNGGTITATTFSGALSGNATTATKFSSNRTIKLTGDVTGEVSSTGESGWNITTTVADNSHNHMPNNITFNNMGLANNIDPITRAYIGAAMSNKTFGLPADAIVIEYSTNGGSTWIDYEATDYHKKNLFAETRTGCNTYLGKATTKEANSVNNQLRITIEPTDRYVGLDALYIWMTTNGNTVYVDLERSTIGAKNTFTTVFTNQQLAGWSGNNIRYFPYAAFGGGTTQTSNCYKYRLTFKQTAINENYPSANIYDIRFLGGSWHSSSISMVQRNHLYSWDGDLNATFPANITATTFNGSLNGNASTATSATNATEATDANKLKYQSILSTDDAIDGFLEANRFKTALWGTTSSPGVANGIILSGGYSSTTYGFQLAINDDPTYFMALRQKNGSGWGAWKRIPMADGTGASGTWGIGISGNATTATTASFANNLWAYAGNEVTIGANNTTAGESTNNAVYINYRDVYGGTITNNATQLTTYYFGNRKGGVTGVTVYAETFSGNATSATKATQDGSGNTITSTYIKKAGDTMTGGLTVEASNSYSSYNEGIRINAGARTYATLLMGGTNGTTSGTNDGAFWIGVYNTGSYTRRLMIAHNGSTGTNTYFYSNAAGTVSPWLHLGNSGTITSGNADAVTGGTVYTALGNYVTLNSAQTLTAAATKTYLGLQTYGSNGVAFGVTNGSTVTQKANVKYDSTLEAIVFSFS